MFALVVMLCSGIVGGPESCSKELIEAPFYTLADCGKAISQHRDRPNIAEFHCERLVREGTPWDKPQEYPSNDQ